MTDEQRRINDRFSEFEQEHCPDFEEFLHALAASFKEQAEAEQGTDDGSAALRAVLLAVAQHLDDAAFDFYVSTK